MIFQETYAFGEFSKLSIDQIIEDDINEDDISLRILSLAGPAETILWSQPDNIPTTCLYPPLGKFSLKEEPGTPIHVSHSQDVPYSPLNVYSLLYPQSSLSLEIALPWQYTTS